MKPGALAFFLSLILTAQFVESREPDHLLPVDQSEDIQYRKIIHEKLEKSSFDCGRVVIMPAFDPERSVSVYSVEHNGQPTTYFITCIIAQESLWGASDMGQLPSKASRVSTERIDHVLPVAAAQHVKEAFANMLKETSPLRPSETPKEIVSEGVIKEYSILLPDGKLARGEVSKYPPITSKMKRLDQLTFDLLEYCKASDANRDRLAKRIEKSAKALTQR